MSGHKVRERTLGIQAQKQGDVKYAYIPPK